MIVKQIHIDAIEAKMLVDVSDASTARWFVPRSLSDTEKWADFGMQRHRNRLLDIFSSIKHHRSQLQKQLTDSFRKLSRLIVYLGVMADALHQDTERRKMAICFGFRVQEVSVCLYHEALLSNICTQLPGAAQITASPGISTSSASRCGVLTNPLSGTGKN